MFDLDTNEKTNPRKSRVIPISARLVSSVLNAASELSILLKVSN